MKRNFFIQMGVILLSIVLMPVAAFASDDVPMADTFRKEGKIYVVVGVFIIIMVGILVLLLALEKRLNKIEKSLKKDSDQ